ncbi:MAG: ABC transporter permease, partial [Pseudomonadota bacterium]
MAVTEAPDERPVDAPVVAAPEEKRGWFTLSPLNRRRWSNFKKNRRAYWSLWIFGIL